MELNVRQSGIERRINNTSYYKTRNGKIHKRVNELYLRNDIPCGISLCEICHFGASRALDFYMNSEHSNSAPFLHVLIFDGNTLLKFIDVLDDSVFRNVIIPQSVWNYVKKISPPIFKRLSFLYQENKSRFFIFLNEFVDETFVDSSLINLPEFYQEQCLLRCASYFKNHWSSIRIIPLIVVSSSEICERLCNNFDGQCLVTMVDYVKGISDCLTLYERVEDLGRIERRGKTLFPDYWKQEDLLDGLSKGTLKKGKFSLSPENYLEAFVTFELEDQWFIQGRANMNRAIQSDIVVVQLLPENEWACPEKVIRLRDAEETQATGFSIQNSDQLPNDENDQEFDGISSAKKPRKEVLPTAQVVGILRRNWRNYCGVIMPPNISGGRQFLFAPAERLIPRIHIETSHYEQLKGKKILVQIDSWPQDSNYPKGHYIRVIGNDGERETEDEVILLEHEIPYESFSPAVLDCLPKLPWAPKKSPHREDLTHLDICSVDPEGCTDIDDALHCTDLGDGRFEVGVHIADVTHFVRPGTPLDQIASERSTTVYLCARRIHMLPDLLSSNLCSLMENEPRYAFSVIWILDSNAKIQSTRFCKSLIRSRAALTYQQAQSLVDDTTNTEKLAVILRNLLHLSRKLKERRRTMGSLELASSEIRFEMDYETGKPIQVSEKKHLSTMSMIEEFMLLANISVAEKTLLLFPDCAILRRHPIPTRLSFKPLISIAESCGFQLNVDTGKELAKSLDEIDVNSRKQNLLVGRMMRMMATRCMTQAVYFAAGTVPRDHYFHYGLATPVYTHFTSPIRRYADVMVHRLLATLLNVDEMHPTMTDRKRLIRLTENMNKRHRHAQYASRASILLNTFRLIKESPEKELDAIIIGIRNNGIQVMVPKFGLESVIYLNTEDGKRACSQEKMQELCNAKGIGLFQCVKISLEVVERNQRKRIDVKLIEPFIEGLSIVTGCEPDQ